MADMGNITNNIKALTHEEIPIRNVTFFIVDFKTSFVEKVLCRKQSKPCLAVDVVYFMVGFVGK